MLLGVFGGNYRFNQLDALLAIINLVNQLDLGDLLQNCLQSHYIIDIVINYQHLEVILDNRALRHFRRLESCIVHCWAILRTEKLRNFFFLARHLPRVLLQIIEILQ